MKSDDWETGCGNGIGWNWLWITSKGRIQH